MTAEVEVLRASEAAERARWLELLAGGRPEAYAHPAYLELFRSGSEQAVLVVYRGEHGALLYPLLLRPLGELDWHEPEDPRFDAVGPPFGWGGPFATCEAARSSAGSFYQAYRHWAREARVICDYNLFCPARLPPAAYPGQLVRRLPVVVRDLSLGPDELWMSYAHKVRKNVKRARAAGLAVEVETEGSRLSEFSAILRHTMRRREARLDERLDDTFFRRLVDSLPGCGVFFHVLDGETVVATELVMSSGDCLYSFLGGTRAEAFASRPGDLLKHSVIRWGAANGFRAFVLGGGVSGEDDIFRFKQSFAPDGRRELEAGWWILDADAYAELVSARLRAERRRSRSASLRAGFFPAYRAPLEPSP